MKSRQHPITRLGVELIPCVRELFCHNIAQVHEVIHALLQGLKGSSRVWKGAVSRSALYKIELLEERVQTYRRSEYEGAFSRPRGEG